MASHGAGRLPWISQSSVPEPVMAFGLLELSSGSVGPFKHFHVAAQSLVAGAAPLLGDVFWHQPLVGKVEGSCACNGTCFCSCCPAPLVTVSVSASFPSSSAVGPAVSVSSSPQRHFSFATNL